MYVCMYIGIHNIINTCLSALTVFDAASHFRSYCSDLASTLWFKRTACVYETKSHYASCPLSARFNPIYIYIYTYIYIHIYAYVYIHKLLNVQIYTHVNKYTNTFRKMVYVGSYIYMSSYIYMNMCWCTCRVSIYIFIYA